MDRKKIVLIILISVIVVVIASSIIPIFVKIPRPDLEQNPVRPPQADTIPQSDRQPAQPPPSVGLEENKQIKTLISFINIGLILPLFVIYAGIYRRMRSSFTLGLMAVIFALGMYAVMSNPLIVSILGGRTGDIGLFEIIPDICATVALVVLVRISLE